ncbi:MAG: segregation/condensation protein A [Candidatus Paceibacterota bacterium]
MYYTVKSDKYTGPLDKLLELVENEKLDINLLSLAKVTNDFLAYLEEIEKTDISNSLISDFLVVASKLILIKSKQLIPVMDIAGDEEEDIKDLEIQLKLYKEVRKTFPFIEDNFSKNPKMASRDFFMNREVVFYPTKFSDAKVILESFKKVIDEIKKFQPIETVKRQTISLKNKIEEILNELNNTTKKTISSGEKKPKGEIIILFLAILHLFRKHMVHLEQDSHFGEINIVKKEERS